MSEKKIEPTDAMVTSAHSAAVGRLMTDPMTYRRILRAALNHPDAAGLFADEDAIRAAREQGWDQAIEWGHYRSPRLINKHGSLADKWRTANPYRPAPDLPTEDGAVIVPADGREFIEQVGDCANYRRLTYDAASGRWIGWDTLNHEADALLPRHITPGTWKVEGE